jgi:hypothetical protein
MNYIINSYRNNSYQRERAVKYALKYALEPNTNFRFLGGQRDGGGDCSNFISQCLTAGGASMIYGTAAPWWYKGKGLKTDTWSYSWTVAHSLYWCLKVRENKKLTGLSAIEVYDMDLLELGDIIQYENPKGRIYHSTIITDFTIEKGAKTPLISQHSFNAVNISYLKPAASKMHFMKIKL